MGGPARKLDRPVHAGEKVRLRFINGASMTFFNLRIPGLSMQVVAADGQDIRPVTVDEFQFGPGETYDVIVTPENRAYTIAAETMDRSAWRARRWPQKQEHRRGWWRMCRCCANARC
jgi:FtsP/CotA-like multicopper oxidase with cupredoxin domain